MIEIGRDSSISRQLQELTQSVRLAKLTKIAFENDEEAAILMEKKQYLETYVRIFQSEKKENFLVKIKLDFIFSGLSNLNLWKKLQMTFLDQHRNLTS